MSTLTLRVDDGPEEPVLTILVDGRDLHDLDGDNVAHLARVMLDDHDAPLLPADPPRRVTLLVCTCGEPGCGRLDALVSREGDEVVWEAGELTFRFDAEPYEAEVRRAMADRSWETPRWTTARLLKAILRERAGELAALGYRFAWAAPSWDDETTMSVSVHDAGRRQLVLRMRTPERPPEEWATALVDELLAGPEGWDVTFRGGRWPEEAST